MPSVVHETPMELIRQFPPLVLEVLRAAAEITVKDGSQVQLVSTDVSEAVPAQYLADGVAVVRDESGTAVLAIVIETQLRDARTKRYTWPSYVTLVRKKNQCDTVLLVICTDPLEAAKCRRTIETGHPGFNLTPIVSDRSRAPFWGDYPGPYPTLYAASIGAIDLETDEGQTVVLEAARLVPEHTRKSCVTLMMAVASETARRAMEEKMGTTAYRNEFIESFYEKGLAEGEAKGEARGHGEDLMKLLVARGIHLTSKNHAQITACTDISQLQIWFDRALTATTAIEVFAP